MKLRSAGPCSAMASFRPWSSPVTNVFILTTNTLLLDARFKESSGLSDFSRAPGSAGRDANQADGLYSLEGRGTPDGLWSEWSIPLLPQGRERPQTPGCTGSEV